MKSDWYFPFFLVNLLAESNEGRCTLPLFCCIFNIIKTVSVTLTYKHVYAYIQLGKTSKGVKICKQRVSVFDMNFFLNNTCTVGDSRWPTKEWRRNVQNKRATYEFFLLFALMCGNLFVLFYPVGRDKEIHLHPSSFCWFEFLAKKKTRTPTLTNSLEWLVVMASVIESQWCNRLMDNNFILNSYKHLAGRVERKKM